MMQRRQNTLLGRSAFTETDLTVNGSPHIVKSNDILVRVRLFFHGLYNQIKEFYTV